MMQAPFGSASPSWMGMPSPGLTWPAAPIPFGGQTVTPLGFGAQASGFGAATPPGTENAAATGLPSSGYGTASGFAAPFTPFTMVPAPLGAPFVVPDGVTAPALMAAIALRRGQPQGPSSDHDVEEFIYDAVELLPGAGEVEVRCEGGRVTLTGTVPHKRLKRDVGDIAWAIPGINDVNNTVTITTRRRSRAFARDTETQQGGTSRKQS